MKPNNKHLTGFFVNNLLLLSGIITALSGLVIQIGYHMGGEHGPVAYGADPHSSGIQQTRVIDPDEIVWGINYTSWSLIHKVAIVLFLILVIYHFCVHWKWYKNVFAKHLLRKNRQVIVLSALFLLVALTGLIPWLIHLSGNDNGFRMILIEIHDKVALLLIIYMFLHISHRVKWFSGTFKKIAGAKRV
jgi:hypothetical protein